MFKKALAVGLGLAALSVAVISCAPEVGLGAEVDVSAPVVNITYPPTSSVIREKFVLAGNCSDDIKVDKVSVIFKNTDTGKSYTVNDSISISGGNKNEEGKRAYTWSVEIDPSESGYNLPDGKYSFTAVATDTSKRVSAESIRSLEIDNTAPFFVISAPGSIKMESAQTYGSNLNIEGQIAEDHNVSLITLSVFDEQNQPLAEWNETDINLSGNTSVTFASINSNEKIFTERYSSIYKSNIGGEQNFYASLLICDSARKWTNPVYTDSKDIKCDEELDGFSGIAGNSTSSVWLNDDVYGKNAKYDFLSRYATHKFEIKDLKELLTGNYSRSLEEELSVEVLQAKLNEIKTDTAETKLAFKLNQDANPSYSILGYSFSGTDTIGAKAAKKGTVSLQAIAGLDGTAFSTDTMMVFLFGPYDASDLENSNFDVEKFYRYGETDQAKGIAYPEAYKTELAAGKAYTLFDGTASPASSGTSKTLTIELPETIIADRYYFISATGYDKDELTFVTKSKYGFIGAASGYPPTVTIKLPGGLKDGFVTGNTDVLKNVEVTVFSTDNKIEKAVCEVTVYDINNANKLLGKITAEKSVAGARGDEKSETFTFDLTAGEWTAAEDVTDVDGRNPAKEEKDANGKITKEGVCYRYDIGVTGYDVNLSSKASVSGQIDQKSPVISVSSVNPIAETKKDETDSNITVNVVNGKVTCTGNILENNIKSAVITIVDEHENTVVRSLGAITNFNESFYLDKLFNDGDEINATLVAVDEAGNESSVSTSHKTIPGSGGAYYYHKLVNDSDKPVISLNAEASEALGFDEIEPNKNLFGISSNNKLSGTISDDDQIGEILVTVAKANNEAWKPEELSKLDGKLAQKYMTDAVGRTSYTFNYQLPQLEGKYVVTVSVKDRHSDANETVQSVEMKFNVAVDAANPVLLFETTNKGRAAANTEKTVKGTASDSSGLKSLIRYKVKTNEDNGETGEKDSWWYASNNGENTISFEGNIWTDTISAEGMGSSNGRRRYIATDIYGNETSLDFIYYIDSEAPVIAEISNPADITAANVFNGNNIYSIKGKVTDNEKEFSSMKYRVISAGEAAPETIVSPNDNEKTIYNTAKGTWNDVSLSSSKNSDEKESTNFTANILLSSEDYADGEYMVYLAVFDAAGIQNYVSDNSVVKITCDKTAPSIKAADGKELSIASTYTTLPVISGKLTETNLEEFKVYYKLAGNTETKETSITPVNGAWSWTLPSVGNYSSIKFKAVDKAGFSDEKIFSTVADTFVPQIKVDPTVAYTNGEWRKSRAQNIQVLVNDTGDAGKTFSSNISSVKYAESAAGLDSSTEELGRGKTVNAEGAADENGVWYVYSSQMSFDSDGEKTIYVRVTDVAGNKKDTTGFTYRIDTVAPVVDGSEFVIMNGEDQLNETVVINANSVIVKSKKTAFENTNDATSKIKSFIIGTSENFDSTSAIGNGAYTYGEICSITADISSVADGLCKLYIKAIDNAGNISSASAINSFKVDRSAPVIDYSTISYSTGSVKKSASSGTTVNKTVTLSGSVTDSNFVAMESLPVLKYWNGTKWETAVIANAKRNDNSWSLDFDTTKISASDAVVTKYFQICVTDAAGNTSFTDGNPAADGFKGNKYQLKIDQASDKPVIKLSNINKTGSAIKTGSVYGTIVDDDGEGSNLALYVIDAANFAANKNDLTKWTKASVDGSNWSVDTEGVKSWCFCVVDQMGTKFVYNTTDGLSVPLIQGKSDETASAHTTTIDFKVDQTPPAVAMEVSSDGKNWSSVGGTFGGETVQLFIRLKVEEAVGMETAEDAYDAVNNINSLVLPVVTIKDQEVSVSITENSGSGVIKNGVFYLYTLDPIDISELELTNGQVPLVASVKDASGQKGQGGLSIIVDNEAPVVSILSPTTSVSDAVTSSATLKGLVTDSYSSIKELQWGIPGGSVGSETSPVWTTIDATASWEIKFSSGTADTDDSLLYYATRSSEYAVSLLDSAVLGIYKVPVWFKATDSIGNTAIIKDQYVVVDVDGGKPKVWVTSPENSDTVSGAVTVYGGASDDISVASVRLQIDVNGDGKFDSSDYNLIKSSAWNDTDLQNAVQGIASDWYILASGTNSWKLIIDTSKMASSIKQLKLRVRAYDDDSNTRPWSTPLTVNIDAEVPVIKDLKLVQFGKNVVPDAETEQITEREYQAGMFISNKTVEENGKWYLTGTVSDNQNVSSIILSDLSYQSGKVISVTDILNPYASIDVKEKRLLIPLETNNGSSNLIGTYCFLITANDDATGTATKSVTVNLDSVAPGMFNTSNAQIEGNKLEEKTLRIKSLSKALGKTASNSSVANNNGFFTFGDSIKEEDSGLSAVAVYFKRNGKVYDPLLKDSSITAEINEDGLPVYKIELTADSGRPSDDSLSYSFTDEQKKHIRKGGLIKIGGTYSTITSVSDNSVSFEPAVSRNFVKAQLVIAQVIDHMLTESDNGAGGVTNDDGDGMIEAVSQIGTTYTWTASLESTNIPDGPVTVCAVAMDNAGNITTGSIETSVTNNRPRIAKVFLGTDLNQSGKYEFRGRAKPVTSINEGTSDGQSYGEFNYYSGLNATTGEAQYNLVLGSAGFKVKSGLAVIPEFVGGNIDTENGQQMGYVMKFANEDSIQQLDNTADTLNFMTAASISSNVVDKSENGILSSSIAGTYTSGKKTGVQHGGIFVDSENVTGSYALITFWDCTTGTTQGEDSQWAHLRIPFTNMSADNTAPVPVIKPFYYTSSTENSIYRNDDGDLQGHIELEKNLNSAMKTQCSDVTGSEKPKVSGKIVVEGTVFDDSLIGSVTASFAGSSVRSSYTTGTWTSTTNAVFEEFTVTDEDLSQEGHKAKWRAVINTEKISGVCGYGMKFTITAANAAVSPVSSTASDVQTKKDAETSCYKMDVVPYITEIWTELSDYSKANASVYSRSGTGNFSVREGETVKIYGWNFGSSSVVTVPVSSGTKDVTLYSTEKGSSTDSDINTKRGTRYLSLYIDSDYASGEISVKNGSIRSMNNINNDSAVYNKLGNGVNNDNLTDTMKLDIWNFKTAASPVGSAASYVHMKVGPYLSGDSTNSGRIGFSYKNAIGYFNMPGHRANAGSGTGIKLYLPYSWANNYVWLWSSNCHNTNTGNYPGTTTVKALAENVTDYYNDSYYYVIDWPNESSFELKIASSSSSTVMDNKKIKSTGVYVASSSAVTRVDDYGAAETNVPTTTVMSQTRMGSNFGGFNYNTFTFDKNGEAYGAAQCPDTSGTNGVSANFQFFSRSVGASEGTLNLNYKNVVNARRIENTSYYKGSTIYTDEFRIQNPEMDTYVSDSTTYVYMAYYDHGLGQVKFRIGSVGSSANTIGMGLQDLNKATANVDDGTQDGGKIGVGDSKVYDSTSSSYVGDQGDAYKYVSVLETSSTSPYVTVGALKTNGTAVVAWYDSADSALKLKYATFSSVTGTSVSWSSEKTVSTVGGKYVSMACDEAGGMHFAYVSNSGADLYYTYLASPTATPYTVLVDSYQDVGDRCQITVGRESTSSPWIPYISYKSNYASHTKIAYPVNFSESNSTGRPLAGADRSEKFTGNWNTSIIPTDAKSIEDTVSVGVLKDWSTSGTSAGVMKVFPTGETVSVGDAGTYSICNSTIVYGNGTKNPVVGYAVEDGYIQMAQKK